MSQITDLILKQVQASANGSNLGNNVLNGLSESILGSVKQTAKSANGIEQITSLFTGKTSAESSPITALAGQLFTSNVASKLGLDSNTTSIATKLLPTIIGALASKNSGLDLSSLLSLVGGADSSKGGLLKTAGSLLGKFLKK